MLLSPLPSCGLSLGVWVEPAHPLPNILMQFVQSVTVKQRLSTLNTNVDFRLYSSMALNVGGQCTFGPPLPESEGVRTPGTPQEV